MTTINDILQEHVTLDIECIDCFYLNGCIPQMQTGGQLVRFLQRRGYAIPSPAILGQLTQQYKREVEQFAAAHDIPIIRFERGVRKEDVVAGYRQGFAVAGRVVVTGIAQEKANGFKASKRVQGQHVGFDYSRQSLFVNYYYFYLQDADFGPAFIKVCSCAPYMVKVCPNGHEWAKQQCRQRDLTFESLDNGFLVAVQQELPYIGGRLLLNRLHNSANLFADGHYDLRRLRLKGLIWRVPQSYRYQLTSYGRKVALSFSKLDARIFRRAFVALDEAAPLPLPLAQALA